MATAGHAIPSRQDARALPPARLILASRSPRRRQLLAEHGIEHEARDPGVDDGLLVAGRITPEQWVAALAYFKAAAALIRSPDPGIFLGADTVCVKDGRVIGQPHDAADAERIVRLLQNGSHEVLSGVALVARGASGVPARRDLFIDRARVHVGRIGDERIASYVAGGAWRGKAGAYNLRERIDDGWPIRYEGEASTIMGLPMSRLLARLAAFGVQGAA